MDEAKVNEMRTLLAESGFSKVSSRKRAGILLEETYFDANRIMITISLEYT